MWLLVGGARGGSGGLVSLQGGPLVEAGTDAEQEQTPEAGWHLPRKKITGNFSWDSTWPVEPFHRTTATLYPSQSSVMRY